MSVRIVPCDSCGSPIPDADLETGQAVTLLGKRYCSGCKADAIQNVSLEDLSSGPPAAARKPAQASKPAAPGPVLAKRAATSPPSPARLERKAPARRPVSPATAPSRTPLIASAAGVVALLCAGGAFLAFRDSPPAPSSPVKTSTTSPPVAPADSEAKARLSFLLVQELAGRPGTSSEVVLAAAEKARSTCKGSAFERPLEAIIAKAQRDREAEVSARELAPLIDELKGAVATDPEFKRYSELQPKFLLAIESAAKSGSPRVNEIRVLQSDYNSRYEKLAEPYYNEIHEAAVALADERRYDDALRKIETFPQRFRNSGSWTTLQKLRQDIERRKKK
ncbi:MAG TPA: hypothetical protein VMU54_19385 [Planctomycetota bacterium]|nr:hypothetical protein [Planctomycetota bacterium]